MAMATTDDKREHQRLAVLFMLDYLFTREIKSATKETIMSKPNRTHQRECKSLIGKEEEDVKGEYIHH
jgi:hypothetical protein